MKKFTYIILTFLFSLIILEIGLSIVFYFKDQTWQAINLPFTKDSPYLYFTFSKSNTDRICHNIDGFRTDNQIEKKDSNIFRIALIGGSVAEFLGCEKDSSNNLLLQTELNNALQTNCIEIIDAGTSAYVVEQEFILTQLILQKYKPDLIIGLHGYNDLVSFKFNRYINDQILLPPLNYHDFLVIEQGKYNAKFISRFSYLFKSTIRAYDFIKHYFNNQNSYDYSSVSEKTYEDYSNQYVNVINDIKDFCQSKGIRYYDFLQPIKYYNNQSEDYLIGDEVPQVTKMYNAFEQKQTNLNYTFSLTHVFDNNLKVYKDDCHVTPEGNVILAKAIALCLKNIIENDSIYLKKQD